MRRLTFPALLLVATLLLGATFVFVGCQQLGDKNETTTTSLAATAATDTTLHVVTTEAPTLVTNRYEQNDPLLKWEGPWTFTGGPEDSGGTCVYTEDNSASVMLKFTGVSVSLVTRVGLSLGEIQVTLDSGTPQIIDCYSPAPGYQQIIWAADPLPNANHYLKLECTGTANPASGGIGIYIDAFAITGTLQALE
jgi:hypothetical protein